MPLLGHGSQGRVYIAVHCAVHAHKDVHFEHAPALPTARAAAHDSRARAPGLVATLPTATVKRSFRHRPLRKRAHAGASQSRNSMRFELGAACRCAPPRLRLGVTRKPFLARRAEKVRQVRQAFNFDLTFTG